MINCMISVVKTDCQTKNYFKWIQTMYRPNPRTERNRICIMKGNHYIWVIPNQFSKSLQVTPSELDETWFVSSTCGFMKPDEMLLSYVVWLPDYSPSKIQLFPDFCWYSNYSNPHNFLILDCFVIPIAPS